MSEKNIRRLVLSTLALLGSTSANAATVSITEWMYSGDEFIEFTNLTGAAVDFTGWSYDDDSRTPGTVSLSTFGVVAPGESAILAEAAALEFRSEWGLAGTVKVIGGNAANLGRNDEINLYDASNGLVDRLSYGDQNYSGTIRTQNASGNPSSLAVLGANDVADWVLSATGDGFGSYSSQSGYVGNPGQFAPAAVPVPAALPLMLSALGAFSVFRRRG